MTKVTVTTWSASRDSLAHPFNKQIETKLFLLHRSPTRIHQALSCYEPCNLKTHSPTNHYQLFNLRWLSFHILSLFLNGLVFSPVRSFYIEKVSSCIIQGFQVALSRLPPNRVQKCYHALLNNIIVLISGACDVCFDYLPNEV